MSRHHKGEFYAGVAQHNGLRVENGKGSHFHMEGYLPDGRRTKMTCYRGELSKGVEHEVRKWFLKLGITLPLIVAAILVAAILVAVAIV